jgi:hypothetical protein
MGVGVVKHGAPMPSTDLLPVSSSAAPCDASALKSLLRRSIEHEEAGGVISGDVMEFGFVASGIVIAGGLLTFILPSAASIRHGDFFWVLGSPAASLDALMGFAAAPAIICGGALLVLDACLMRVRTSWRWRYVVVAQAVAGCIAGVFCTLFLALVILNAVIWIVIYALIFVIIGAIIVSLVSANTGND